MNWQMLLQAGTYLAASLLFILGLRALSHPDTARKGMQQAAVGMTLAILGTLIHVIAWHWIVIGLVVGSFAGYVIAVYTPLTALPERTALSHAFGAMAAALVGVAEFYKHYNHGFVLPMDRVQLGALGFEVLLGGLTFTGSMMAFAKLKELMRGSPITFKGQNVFNLGILGAAVALLIYLIVEPASPHATLVFYAMIGLSFLFGILLVLPIGAADMPVVISLLNSYAGLAACATGFVLDNKVLIIAGALDGASGVILSIIMCKAMNRSMMNVLFGAFGQAPASAATAPRGAAAPAGEAPKAARISAEETATLAMNAKLVIVVPGYGMAAAQAQHGVREFADTLKSKGVKVLYAIHPVAGRMPGHMNVLLAEARVPYDELIDMDDINPDFPKADLALVIGANDVTNPAARHNTASPIYGMPILDVDYAKKVVVCKRSMGVGFAGIDNELYYMPQTSMLLGDAKGTAEKLAKAVKELAAGKVPVAQDAAAPAAVAPAAAPAPNRIKVTDSYYAGKILQGTPVAAADLLAGAQKVVIVPGYGMARAQAHLVLNDLVRTLIARGKDVVVALHPFAGRMPGHMNFLLNEADVPFELQRGLEDLDGALAGADVALVVGANDVVNPDRTGPLDGMPALDVARAKKVVVLKRELGAGCRGVPNSLFTRPNTMMVFGDAKQSIESVMSALTA